MKNEEIQKRPSYAVQAVDNALQLLQLLRDTGAIRIKDAASELNIAPSTAHRLLSMLKYRGFAVQDEWRQYRPGPAMRVGPVEASGIKELKSRSQPHLERLSATLDETVNLMIRVGTTVRFLSTVEGTNVLRVTDRQGAVLPAATASGGKALLAELPEGIIDRLYGSDGTSSDGAGAERRLAALREELNRVRSNGYAVNQEETESGIGAVGMALHGAGGGAVAAFSVSVPLPRLQTLVQPVNINVIQRAAGAIEADIADIEWPQAGTVNQASPS